MISEMVQQASTEMAGKLEDEVRKALDEIWPVWTMDDVKQRCRIVKMWNSPIETLCADGVPLLEIHPIESEIERTEHSYVIRYTRRFRNLRVPPTVEVTPESSPPTPSA